MFDKELDIAKQVARQAGTVMLDYFDGDQKLERKADNSPVTVADKTINSMIITELSKHFDYGIVGEEESNATYGSGRRWLCDPLDGTQAYTWGIPTAMFSLALIVDGLPVLGVAYDPFLDRLYEGVRGQGSFCNGQPLKVSPGNLRGNYIAVPGHLESIVANPSPVQKLLSKKAFPASFSGAVYKGCLVSKGRVVGFFDPGVSAYDVAAVHVIVTEAGGVISGINGETLDYTKPFKGVIISNGVVHDDLLKCIRG
jgi:fructose-1,6-bisphosphatase/inositol monophosphatase family enzyme